MEEDDRANRLVKLANSLNTLIEFAEEDENFLLAAMLDVARVRFNERYALEMD